MQVDKDEKAEKLRRLIRLGWVMHNFMGHEVWESPKGKYHTESEALNTLEGK